MGDDHHGALARVQYPFQPANGVDVEVVGGLVQQQDIRVGEQGLGQQHPQLQARGDFAHGTEVQFRADAGAQQDLAGAALRGVAIHLGEVGLQLRDFHAVLVGHLRQAVDAVALLLYRPQLGVAHDHRVDHGILLEGELILAQLADTLIGRDRHVAGAGRQAAIEDFHQGRLAATIGADEAVTVAVAELDGNVFEQGLGAKLHGDVCCADHCGVPGGKMGGARFIPRQAADYTGCGGMSRAWSEYVCRVSGLCSLRKNRQGLIGPRRLAAPTPACRARRGTSPAPAAGSAGARPRCRPGAGRDRWRGTRG